MENNQIQNIENGMEMETVRSILNSVIARVNELSDISNNYEDLEGKPAIDGIILSAASKMSDFTVPASAIGNLESFKDELKETAVSVAQQSANASLTSKLGNNFTTLQKLEYEFDDSMLVAIDSGKGTIYKTTLGNLVTYLKHAILKINDQYLRVIQ